MNPETLVKNILKVTASPSSSFNSFNAPLTLKILETELKRSEDF
jgi:hypothetical protein